MKLSLALSPTKGRFAPLFFAGDLKRGIDTAAALGYEAVELSIGAPSDLEPDRVRRWLRSACLDVSAIATGKAYYDEGLSLCHPEPSVRERARRRLRELTLLGAELGARYVIVGALRGQWPERTPTWPVVPAVETEEGRWLLEALAVGQEFAARYGLSLVVEPINRYETNCLNTASEVLSVLKRLGGPPPGLLLDTFHMNIEEVSIVGALVEARDCLRYMHFADSNRQVPGRGHTDFSSVIGILHSLNYDGYVGIEALPLPDDTTAASDAVSYWRALRRIWR